MNERDDFEELLARSSIGDAAWIECPRHGHQPVDPFVPQPTCIECAGEDFYGLEVR